jgi:hypothetical protein
MRADKSMKTSCDGPSRAAIAHGVGDERLPKCVNLQRKSRSANEMQDYRPERVEHLKRVR